MYRIITLVAALCVSLQAQSLEEIRSRAASTGALPGEIAQAKQAFAQADRKIDPALAELLRQGQQKGFGSIQTTAKSLDIPMRGGSAAVRATRTRSPRSGISDGATRISVSFRTNSPSCERRRRFERGRPSGQGR